MPISTASSLELVEAHMKVRRQLLKFKFVNQYSADNLYKVFISFSSCASNVNLRKASGEEPESEKSEDMFVVGCRQSHDHDGSAFSALQDFKVQSTGK